MATGNPLSARSLAAIIGRSLPKSASPQIKNAYDAVALASHAAMVAVGFRLVGLSEEQRLPSAVSDGFAVLPTSWNESPASNYSFLYAHTQSSMEFLLRVHRMGSKAVVMGMALGDDKTPSFDLRVNDYVSPSSLPASPTSIPDSASGQESDTTAGPQSELPADMRKAIEGIFISNGRLSDFGNLMRLNMIQKIIPSLQKAGYEESTQNNHTNPAPRAPPQPSSPPSYQPSHLPEPARPTPLHDPLYIPPNRPQGWNTPDFHPPGFEDEHQMLRHPLRNPSRGLGGAVGTGHRDLYPQGLGPNDPFRPMGPALGGLGGGGGMHPTFDDPLFRGQGRGGYGGDDLNGYDMQAPPGARYDPIGPGGAPRDGSRFGRPGAGGGSGFGGGPPNPFGGYGDGDFI